MKGLRPLLLDACGLINISATGRTDDIAAFLGGLFVVEDVADEAPGAIAAAAVIQVLALEDDEAALFVELAAVDGMDAGEAATFAVAASRELDVVTDDRRAIRAALEHVPSVRIHRTATVIRAFVEKASLSAQEVVSLIDAIEEEASFVPAVGTPDADWWMRMKPIR